MNGGRPKKVRFVQKMPKVVQFSPRGKPGRPDEVELSVDEFEALKLSDYQGFNQSQGATMMRLSRPSFGRILRIARKKIAEALVCGKVIKIRMGTAQIGVLKQDFHLETFEEELVKFGSRQARVKSEINRIAANDAEGLDSSVKEKA